MKEKRLRELPGMNLPFYITGFAVIFIIKLYYSKAGTDELRWILAPTARWAGILGGISFDFEAQRGYVNHELRFIIASSCSGVRFLLVSMAALIFSFIHRMKTRKGKFFWMAGSMVFSCLFTVFVNGIRIVSAIYLPIRLGGILQKGGWLSPERLHTLIGIIIYLPSLFLLYRAADFAAWRIEKSTDRAEGKGKDSGASVSAEGRRPVTNKYLAPLFWYFAIVLGIPFLNGALWKNREGFLQYAGLVSGTGLGIMLLLRLGTAFGIICRSFFHKGNR